jgi:hypothetical protein
MELRYTAKNKLKIGMMVMKIPTYSSTPTRITGSNAQGVIHTLRSGNLIAWD